MPRLPLPDVHPLHIPDGFLGPPIALLFWIVTAVLIVVAVRRTGPQLGERQVPLLGVMAAFIFAAQMINVPIAGGTSGHLLGGALAAIALGPWPALLVMTSVLAVQGLLFQDGGLLVMGANIFNMGFLTAVIGYGLYRLVAGQSRGVRLAVAGAAAWLSVMAAALVTALQLWLSGTSPLELVVPAMLGVHAVFGLVEAAITVGALGFLMATRPELFEPAEGASRGGRGWAVAGLLVSLAVVLLAPLASTDPDGLESVAEELGFLDRAAEAPYTILPDYTVPFLGEGVLSTIVAGTIGTLVVALVAAGVVWALRRPGRSEPQPGRTSV